MTQQWKRMTMLLLLCGLTLTAAEPRMTPEERARALDWMTKSRQEFLASLEGVTERQWTWKSSPDRWSIGEVAEHIVLAEAAQFARVQQALAAPVNADWEEKTKGKTAMLESILAPRVGKAQAPEAIVPQGKMTLAEAKARFEKQRLEIVKFAAESNAPLKEHTIDNPFFGTLNGYHWLIYAPLHTLRHVKQIAEVKATAGYPK